MDKRLEDYIYRYSEEEPDILKELARETHIRMLRPRMLSGAVQGGFLRMLCKISGARSVLDIGSFTGYSAISMGLGLSSGCVHTIEKNEEYEDFIRKYMDKSGLNDIIRLYIGDALEIIPAIPGSFDLVYRDGEKRQYAEYYKTVIPRLRPGGIIVADDVLWNGKVLEGGNADDAQTRGIAEFNEMVRSDTGIENILLPLRHGIMVIRKK